METITKLETVFDGVSRYRTDSADYEVENTGSGIYSIYEKTGDAFFHVGRYRANNSFYALVKYLKQFDDEYSLDD